MPLWHRDLRTYAEQRIIVQRKDEIYFGIGQELIMKVGTTGQTKQGLMFNKRDSINHIRNRMNKFEDLQFFFFLASITYYLLYTHYEMRMWRYWNSHKLLVGA